MKFLSGALLLSLSLTSLAEIRETNSMKAALADIGAGDLVVFDLDNTVLEPKQTLGSDQWWSALVEQNKKHGMSEAVAVEAAIVDWEKVQKKTEMRTVEETTPAIIKNLQARKVEVFALTARPETIKYATKDQLRSVGINLSEIVFIGPKLSKGQMLSDIISKMNYVPKRVIFVDDKEKHVKSVDESLKNSGITNINYRYGAADPQVKAYDQKIADIEWDYFEQTGVILSDREASELR